MSSPITGRERYEWLVPPDSRAKAHAFIPGARYSICLKPERYGWVAEVLAPGEPRRARCEQCTRILGRKGNEGMQAPRFALYAARTKRLATCLRV